MYLVIVEDIYFRIWRKNMDPTLKNVLPKFNEFFENIDCANSGKRYVFNKNSFAAIGLIVRSM